MWLKIREVIAFVLCVMGLMLYCLVRVVPRQWGKVKFLCRVLSVQLDVSYTFVRN